MIDRGFDVEELYEEFVHDISKWYNSLDKICCAHTYSRASSAEEDTTANTWNNRLSFTIPCKKGACICLIQPQCATIKAKLFLGVVVGKLPLQC